jgi:hypothetical protein
MPKITLKTAGKPQGEVQSMHIEIACCGMFRKVDSVPWTCPTCRQTHLGAAPPTFLCRVMRYVIELEHKIRDLQEDIVTRTQAMRRLQVEQEALHAYLALMEKQQRMLEAEPHA